MKPQNLLKFFLPLLLASHLVVGAELTSTSYSPTTFVEPSQFVAEIDALSVNTVEEIGGGFYCREVDAVVPLFPSLVRLEWLNYKNAIAEKIGPVFPGPSKESAAWSNSTTSIDQLIVDAKEASNQFLSMCLKISQKTGCSSNFGVDNQYMIKSKKSIESKINEAMTEGLSKEEAIRKIRDTLRGTIIADRVEQIPLIVQALKNSAREMGREVIFINIWNDNRASGYVGIHAKMLFPIYDEKGKDTKRSINAEIQIHLKSIMDGTQQCAKERAHLIYNQMHTLGIDSKIQTSSSMLLYLTALKQSSKDSLGQVLISHQISIQNPLYFSKNFKKVEQYVMKNSSEMHSSSLINR